MGSVEERPAHSLTSSFCTETCQDPDRDQGTSLYCSHSARDNPLRNSNRALSRVSTEMRRSTLTMKALASLKAVRAAFSKRYPSLESYIDHVFSGYDDDEDGFLSTEQLAMMLKDFHREFAIEVSMKEETLLAEYLVTLCSGDKCTQVNPNENVARYQSRCGKNGLTKICFTDILDLKLKQESDSFSYDMETNLMAEESIQEHSQTRFHHRIRSVIQWSCAAVFMLLFAAVAVWVMISPDYKSGDFWSLYSNEIIVARIGAGLAISGTFFCLLFINMYFVHFLLENKSMHLHIHLNMISLHKFYAAVILIGGLMHTIAWFVLYDEMVCICVNIDSALKFNHFSI